MNSPQSGVWNCQALWRRRRWRVERAVEVKAENYEALKKMLMQALTEAGVLTHDDAFKQSNQMNVLAIYSTSTLTQMALNQTSVRFRVGLVTFLFILYKRAGDFRGLLQRLC